MATMAHADIYINLLAVNALETPKDTPVKYYLPKELDPQDIVDPGGLVLDYDINKAAYYLHGNVSLGSKETKTIKVKVKDVWRIPQEEIDILKAQIKENVDLLDRTDYADASKILGDDMISKLDYIVKQQTQYSDNIERRIEEYRAYLGQLEEIRTNAFSTEYFRSARSVEKKSNNVKFIVEVENPSALQKKDVQEKHYLPYEVRDEDVVEAQGFDIRFDDEKKQPYLYKEESFDPGQKKRYEIVIRDIWQIDVNIVEEFRKKAEKVFGEIKGSEYEGNAGFIFDGIITTLDRVLNTKASKDDMKKYIGNYRSNMERLGRAEKDIDKLEKILAFVKAKKLEEMEKKKVKNVLQRLQALRGIAAIAKAVFGKRPSITLTWKIIWGTMAFVAFFTTIHFFTWWKRSKKMGEEMGLKPGETLTVISEAKEKVEEEK